MAKAFFDLFLLPHPSLELSSRDSMRIGFNLQHTVELTRFAPEIPFPQLWGYTSFGADPVPPGNGSDAGPHFAFAHASTTQPNVIGLYNTEAGRSTNALNMHRIYADQEVTSGSADIRIQEFIELIPEPNNNRRGQVRIIAQNVRVNRRASSGLPPFNVGISGSGTFDVNTGIILLDVYFNETEIGGQENILRRYSLEAQQRN
ncbi:MAG: hypothetical protein HC821_02505 [Lewinella sp.]|nr:hypothetical protein [Lewinella sp.]